MTERARPTLITGVHCRDARAEIEWLQKAFGFEVTMIVEMEDGAIGHSKLRLGDGMIMVGGEYDGRHKSPLSIGGINSQAIHVTLHEDIDTHCARAIAAGAVVTRELADEFYGDRVYGVADPEGHIWTFSQATKTLTIEEMNAAGGVSIRDHL